MIGYVLGREFGYWLLLRYGNYVGMSESRIKLGQYLFLRHGGKIVVRRAIRAGVAHLRRDFRRRQCHAVAQLSCRQCLRLDALGA